MTLPLAEVGDEHDGVRVGELNGEQWPRRSPGTDDRTVEIAPVRVERGEVQVGQAGGHVPGEAVDPVLVRIVAWPAVGSDCGDGPVSAHSLCTGCEARRTGARRPWHQ